MVNLRLQTIRVLNVIVEHQLLSEEKEFFVPREYDACYGNGNIRYSAQHGSAISDLITAGVLVLRKNKLGVNPSEPHNMYYRGSNFDAMVSALNTIKAIFTLEG